MSGRWKLQLPTPAGSSSIDQRTAAQIEAGYSSRYFQADPTGAGVLLMAPTSGAPTSESGYPRSELREMASDGTTLAGWDSRRASDGYHEMTVTTQINHLPARKGDMVIAQVHDGPSGLNSDVVAVKSFSTEAGAPPRLAVTFDKYSTYGVDVPGWNPVKLGVPITIRITAYRDVMKVYVDDMRSPVASHGSLGAAPYYFKTGAYVLARASHDGTTDYGEVLIRKLSVKHLSAPPTTSTSRRLRSHAR